MAKFLIHVTCGVENPTKAVLAFLVAKAALEEKHEVDLFLAAEAVQLLVPAVIENLQGLATGSLKTQLEGVLAGGGRLHVSGLSAKSRGIEADRLGGLPVQFAMPSALVRLAAQADKVLCY